MQTDQMGRGRFVMVGMLGVLGTLWAASCQGPQEFFRDSGIVNLGTGGILSTGGRGASASGGSSGSTGGTIVTGTGGVGTGGTRATGGVTGTGGVATGGITGTGGKATGGVTGTGGVTTGGATGTGGTATGAAGSTGTAANCVDAIKMAGYSSGSQMCSTCKENSQDKSAACEAVIDCLDMKYPCGSANNCALQCNNSGAADSVVTGCVRAILGTCATP